MMKTYNKTCVTNKDTDQPLHPPSMAMVLVYASLDSQARGCKRHIRSAKTPADAQSALSLRWSHKSYVDFVVRWLICVVTTIQHF